MTPRNAVSKLALLLTSVSIAGCASIPLDPGAQSVKVVLNPVSKSCKSLGQITAENISGITVAYTSQANLKKNASPLFKKSGIKIRGNVVVVTGHSKTWGSPTYIIATGTFVEDSRDFGYQTTGMVYRCPLSIADSLMSE